MLCVLGATLPSFCRCPALSKREALRDRHGFLPVLMVPVFNALCCSLTLDPMSIPDSRAASPTAILGPHWMQRQQPAAMGFASSQLCKVLSLYPLYHSEQLYLSDQTLADTSLFPGSPQDIVSYVTAPKTFVHGDWAKSLSKREAQDW